MKLDINSLLFLLAGLQCLVFSIGINLKKPLYSDLKKITTYLLLCMMFVMIYYIMIFDQSIAVTALHHSIGGFAWMCVPPLYYLLFKCLHEGAWQLSWKHVVFFPIPILFLLDGMTNTIGNFTFLFAFATTSQAVVDVWMTLFLMSGLFFAGRTILVFQKDEEDHRGNKLIWFSYLLFGVLVIYSALYIYIREKYNVLFETSLVFLFAVFVFSLVFRSFKLMSIRSLFDMSKYDKTALSQKKIKEFALRLEKLMLEEKPYLTKKLSLNDLSTMSGISSTDLSQLFSLYYRASFYEFINRYRLNYLESMLLDPSYKQFKIMALAEESGFNSKATFYKVFKEKHLLTPMQYLKKHMS